MDVQARWSFDETKFEKYNTVITPQLHMHKDSFLMHINQTTYKVVASVPSILLNFFFPIVVSLLEMLLYAFFPANI